jgi:Flp pilus assembly protein TadD
VDDVLARQPMNLEALEAKALFTTWAGRYRESIHVYDQLLALSQSSQRHLLPRARLLVYDQRFQEAVVGYQRVLEAAPEDADALMGLGQVLSWLGRLDEAETVYQRLLAVHPTNVDARRGLAQVATWRGDLKLGETRWREAVQSSPEDVGARVGLAANLRMQGRGSAAKDVLDEAARLGPANQTQLDERLMVDRSIAPALTPSWSYLSDSDRNRIQTLSVSGRVHVADPLQVTVNVARRALEQGGRPELADEVLAADVVVTTRASSGWGAVGGVGIWQPGESGAEPLATLVAGVQAPPWWPARADLTFTRSAFDVTALAAQGRVEVREARLEGSARLGMGTSLSATASAARFQNPESNTRILGAARLSHRMHRWVAAGPALRAFSFEKGLEQVYWSPRSYFVAELPVAFGPAEGQFVPRLEVAPGYQRSSDLADPWSVSVRVQGGFTYNMSPSRQVGVSALFANSGFQRLAVADSNYEARGVTLLVSWAF